MKTFKKIVSVVVMIGIVSSQIGCAGKVQKISAPLDEVQYRNHYDYKFQMNDGSQVSNIEGNQIQVKENYLEVKTNKIEKKLLKQEIKQIDILSEKNGSYVWDGLKGGLLAGFLLGGILGFIAYDGFPPAGLFFGGLGALPGAVFGAAIGATIPKRNRIQITPIISPTPSGVNAGANLGVSF